MSSDLLRWLPRYLSSSFSLSLAFPSFFLLFYYLFPDFVLRSPLQVSRVAQNGSSQKRDRQGLAYQNRLPHGQAAQYETLRVSLSFTDAYEVCTGCTLCTARYGGLYIYLYTSPRHVWQPRQIDTAGYYISRVGFFDPSRM